MSNQGKRNVYTCQSCGRRIVTIDSDNGVTPFAIRCFEAGGSCDGSAHSSFYRADPRLAPTHEWRRPRGTKHLAPGEREHVRLGGLLLYPISRTALRRLAS